MQRWQQFLRSEAKDLARVSARLDLSTLGSGTSPIPPSSSTQFSAFAAAPSPQHRPQRQRRLAEEPALVLTRQERQLLASHRELLLEATIVRRRIIGSPHDSLCAEPVQYPAEKFLAGALSFPGCVDRLAGELQIEIREAHQVEQRLQ